MAVARDQPERRLRGPLARPARARRSRRDGMSFTKADDVREFVASFGAGAGLTAERCEDLVLAVNELATNSIRHGGGRGRLRAWVEEGVVVCEVSDRGFIRDAAAGHHPPPLESEGGRGLWLAHQICDEVGIHSSPRGTTVQVRMAGPAGP